MLGLAEYFSRKFGFATKFGLAEY